jgi:hypothetical protein
MGPGCVKSRSTCACSPSRPSRSAQDRRSSSREGLDAPESTRPTSFHTSRSNAGPREQRLTGSTIHETGSPESRLSPPTPTAALLSPSLKSRTAARGPKRVYTTRHEARFSTLIDSVASRAPVSSRWATRSHSRRLHPLPINSTPDRRCCPFGLSRQTSLDDSSSLR